MQQISGFLTRRALLVAFITFGIGIIIMILLLVGTFTSTAPPITAAVELPTEELPVEALSAEQLPADPEPDEQGQPTARAENDSVVVYVSGAVSAPDVYRLPAGARVKDLIVAAGGFSGDADPEAINLAARISDAQQIKVPRRGQVATPSSSEPAQQPSNPSESKLINLNTASAAELDQLPGIGLAIAERIIDYRSTNGPFESIDDLGNVKGIGAALIERITPLVTVGA